MKQRICQHLLKKRSGTRFLPLTPLKTWICTVETVIARRSKQKIADPNVVTLLCEQGGRFLGFAQLRWDKIPSCVVADAPSEIQRLYVINDFHGKGVAQNLIQACMDEMATRQSDVVWLGVWERNLRAIAFYKKIGFCEVGEHVFPLGHDPQRDLVMARPVSHSRSGSS